MKMQCIGKLNHLSLPTTDPTATAVFLEKYFGCRIVTAGKNILLEHDGFDIVLDGTTEKSDWPANFHFGFEVETLHQVEQLYEALFQEGVHMETEVFNNSRGSRFFCRTPGGVMIEVNTREDKQDEWRMLF